MKEMWKILKRRCMYRGECPSRTGKFHHKKQICSIHCYPPITEVTQSTYNQNGEFEAAHCRKANCQRRLAARRQPKGRIKRSTIYLSDINHKHLFLFLFRRNVKRVCRKALAVHRCYANHKHTERRIVSGTLPHGKAPCTLGGGTRGFPLGYNSEAI